MTYGIISGLPASGKSTLARRLAPRLSLPLLDKDDILEDLFGSLGVGDAAWRATLSRSADDTFAQLAPTLGAGLLVSWWRHPKAQGESGTPTAWLATLAPPTVEIHCVCPPDLAAARFMERTRHAGHLDETRRMDDVVEEFSRLSLLGPLAFGPVALVDTREETPLGELVSFVKQWDRA